MSPSTLLAGHRRRMASFRSAVRLRVHRCRRRSSGLALYLLQEFGTWISGGFHWWCWSRIISARDLIYYPSLDWIVLQTQPILAFYFEQALPGQRLAHLMFGGQRLAPTIPQVNK